MQTLDQNLQQLLAKGVISKQDARLRAANKESFA
jgi:twitching motility protein PilT